MDERPPLSVAGGCNCNGSVWIAVLLVAITALWYWCGNWIRVALLTSKRDSTGMFRYLRLLYLVRRLQRSNATLGTIFEETVRRHPQKACFIFEEQTWTFDRCNRLANRVAQHFRRAGYRRGDVVGLLMETRPEFVCLWLGLSKLGVIVPLINTNLRHAALLHSITVANCRALVFSGGLRSAVHEVAAELPAVERLQYNAAGEEEPVLAADADLSGLLERCDDESNAVDADADTDAETATGGDGRPASKHHAPLMYIYTSGTTGLPKAAVITHSRFVFIAAGIHYVAALRDDDIFYSALPLYHTAGGVMSVGQALLFGSTLVLRRKFSASAYFADCRRHGCTAAQYIGEMCRYVLATKPSAADREHSVRTIFGNGLRPQIWPQFVERFGIRQVAEFYGATEGNANIVNLDSTVGAIGFVSRILPAIYPISIIRADANTGEPIRGPDGLCQRCAPNEPGVFIGKIAAGNPSRAFLGYVDKKASSKKVVRDVFRRGDAAFLSGDVLVADELGYLFFKDRTGDTFRWKGENVSTSEVEAQVSNVADYRDTVVYGVEIPNLEGRAGMAAILDPTGSLDLTQLAAGLCRVLPSYARPQFVRLLTKVDMTGTFKLKKVDLQKDGYRPSAIEDAVFYMTARGAYERLTEEVYEKICSGEVRL